MSVKFPDYVDGKPPVISLFQYDSAGWAKETAVDVKESESGKYFVAVNIQKPDEVVARFEDIATPLLQKVFTDAHQTYGEK
ncbi:Hypothetical protein PP7435_CHR4-0410 [Komagataella phaffii CBS 7435]|uniref:Uncharacterized protein n=1 Tax=Komagataella phaffii (strain ATCC 76273 / CBS 7435 / CECT 11047 / NRRL Y-11430 / Wegner 21-1) TaxID=981350 RepID=F2QYU9_KOMPC|nr:Hypothetical protein BQ9382_C4-2130 [Komagataella phaffii CBS 7435]CCA40577.1 Hypothetical protein PP7435_CHR4-0410 [Komagataella phaffii CBS 7435]